MMRKKIRKGGLEKEGGKRAGENRGKKEEVRGYL